MAYEKQTFIDREKDASGNVLVEGTKLKAEHLNHIEEGIVANEEAIASATSTAEAAIESVASTAQTAAEAAAEAKETANAAATAAAVKELPDVTETDDGKLLQVVGGKWSAVAITDGNNVAY